MPVYIVARVLSPCRHVADTPWRNDPRVSSFVDSPLHAAVLDHDVEHLKRLLKTHSPDEAYNGVTPLRLAEGMYFLGSQNRAPRRTADPACARVLHDAKTAHLDSTAPTTAP